MFTDVKRINWINLYFTKKYLGSSRKNFLTLIYLENRMSHPHPKLFFFFFLKNFRGINFLHGFIMPSVKNMHISAGL